jgi:phage N-6-adenine-methyltransferase
MPAQKPHRSKQDYSTPDEFISAVQTYLGIDKFCYDFAADRHNKKATEWFDELANALTIPFWDDYLNATGWGWGWLNPPYTNIGPWAARCLETSLAGGKIAFLVPASVGSNWYRDYIHDQFGVKVLFLNGRIGFMPDNPKWLYPKDCALVLFGTGTPFAVDVWTWKRTTEWQKPQRTRSAGLRKPRIHRNNESLPPVTERSAP